MDDRLIESMTAAVQASPEDMPLRLHLAALLIDAGRAPEAVTHAAVVLSAQPGSTDAREVMMRAMGSHATDTPRPSKAPEGTSPPSDTPDGFNWGAAESDLGEAARPMFVDGSVDEPGSAPHDVEQSSVRLTDVGGLEDVKKRLEASFLAPLRNPELRRLYGKSLKGGLLLYGPPGCGKTFMAKAVAGELGASFLHVSLADILDMFVGQSERNVKELFEVARSSAPCVLFLDELDAIGGKRSLNRLSGARTTVNQLLTELDGVGSDNEGVFVLAATNSPWDVDPALRRPGRLDRTLLVLPPDREAREAILRTHLSSRPVEKIDIRKIARTTEGFSGADLAHLCESASELALMDSVASGQVRMIGMSDFEAARAEIRPSIRPWVETARNVALYANQTGEYDELAKWLRKQRS